MILPMLLAAATAAAPAPAAVPPAPSAARALPEPSIAPKAESGCGYIVLKVTKPAEPARPAEGGKPAEPAKPAQAEREYHAVKGFRVLGSQSLNVPEVKEPVWAFRCTRDTIVPAQGDGRILVFLKKPLILTDGNRAGALTAEHDKFIFTMLSGKLSEAERDSIAKRLTIINANLAESRKASAAQTPPATEPAPPPAKRGKRHRR